MAHDVFVSYASEDKTVADAVVATLEQQGIRCWVAPRDVIPGHGFGEDVVAAIHSSQIVVLLLSAHANGSATVMRELERAVNDGLSILPLRLEDVTPSGELTYYLSDAHWLDAITPPLEQHVRRLADTIRLLLLRAEEEVAPGPVVAASGRPGGFVRAHLRWVVAAVALLVILVVAAGVLLTRGDGGGQADSRETGNQADGVAEEADGSATTRDPFVSGAVEGTGYGDDPALDALYDRCDEGDPVACDDLYLDAPIDSEYESFGSTCGNRQPALHGGCEAEEAGHYGDDPALDGLYDRCQTGDMTACDTLYYEAPIDSEYEEFAVTCGNREIPSNGGGYCEEEGAG